MTTDKRATPEVLERAEGGVREVLSPLIGSHPHVDGELIGALVDAVARHFADLERLGEPTAEDYAATREMADRAFDESQVVSRKARAFDWLESQVRHIETARMALLLKKPLEPQAPSLLAAVEAALEARDAEA